MSIINTIELRSLPTILPTEYHPHKNSRSNNDVMTDYIKKKRNYVNEMEEDDSEDQEQQQQQQQGQERQDQMKIDANYEEMETIRHHHKSSQVNNGAQLMKARESYEVERDSLMSQARLFKLRFPECDLVLMIISEFEVGGHLEFSSIEKRRDANSLVNIARKHTIIERKKQKMRQERLHCRKATGRDAKKQQMKRGEGGEWWEWDTEEAEREKDGDGDHKILRTEKRGMHSTKKRKRRGDNGRKRDGETTKESATRLCVDNLREEATIITHSTECSGAAPKKKKMRMEIKENQHPKTREDTNEITGSVWDDPLFSPVVEYWNMTNHGSIMEENASSTSDSSTVSATAHSTCPSTKPHLLTSKSAASPFNKAKIQ